MAGINSLRNGLARPAPAGARSRELNWFIRRIEWEEKYNEHQRRRAAQQDAENRRQAGFDLMQRLNAAQRGSEAAPRRDSDPPSLNQDNRSRSFNRASSSSGDDENVDDADLFGDSDEEFGAAAEPAPILPPVATATSEAFERLEAVAGEVISHVSYHKSAGGDLIMRRVVVGTRLLNATPAQRELLEERLAGDEVAKSLAQKLQTCMHRARSANARS